MANIRDAIKLHVEDRLASNEPITTSEVISFSSLEVAV
jgi:predicted RNase H-like HicB family nuclease